MNHLNMDASALLFTFCADVRNSCDAATSKGVCKR